MAKITPTFQAKVVDKVLDMTPETTDAFFGYIATLDGRNVEIIVKEIERQRSNPQNAYYWGVVIKMIAEYSGYNATKADYERVHDTLRMMFLKRQDGFLNKERVLSTTELNTSEFEEYLAQIRQWAAIALNLVIPLPNETVVPDMYIAA